MLMMLLRLSEQEDKLKDKINKEICIQAIEVFGQANQLVVAMEECSELIQALSKFIRGVDHNVEEEIADVEIMLEQLKIIFDIKEVERIRNEKLKRLRDMII